MTKHIRMTVTSTIEITAPLADNEQHLTNLTDKDRARIRFTMKRDVIERAKASNSKVKNVVVSSISLMDLPPR